jgi:PAS domain S-box-containing protein
MLRPEATKALLTAYAESHSALTPRRMDILILLMVVSFAITVVSMQVSALWRQHDREIAQARAVSRDLVRISEEYMSRVLETSELIALEAIHHIRELGGVGIVGSDFEAHRYLRDLSQRTTNDSILLVDSRGRPIVATSQFPPRPLDFGEREWFKAHLARGVDRHVGRAVVSRVSGEVMFTYSRAIRDVDGGLEGVVRIAKRPHFFQRGALTNELFGDVALGVWNLQGGLVARTGITPEQAESSYADTAFFRRFLAADSGTFEDVSPFEGHIRIVSFQRLDQWQLIVSASVPMSSALFAYHESLRQSIWQLAMVLTALLVLAVIALRLSRREANAQTTLRSANKALTQSRDDLEVRVTERTHELAEAAERTRADEARFRGIFNSTFQFIGLLRPDGTVLEVNQTALSFAGLDPRDVIGKPFWETRWWSQCEDSRARLKASIKQAAAGEFVRYEAEMLGEGESRALVDFSLKAVTDGRGRVVLLVSEGRDISDLKAAQARLHESQKLELLGQLTGGVAHDFNNLLTVVLSNLDLLGKRLAADPEMRLIIQTAIHAAERGATLTQRLLAFARRQDLRPEVIDLRDLVLGMADLLARSTGAAIRIVYDLPLGLPPVRADANQLELALLNLVLNSRDAMPGGGSLTVALRHRDDRPEEGTPSAAGFVCLTVTDTGEGMDDKTAKACIEPFFTTKQPGKGSGLGLSMVHGLAEQSGGWMRIETAPGKGTEISIALPVAEPGAVVKPVTVRPEILPASRPYRILLAEDDVLVALGVTAVLEDMGHQVTRALDGAQALSILNSGEVFDLMITDYAMPGMTGLELAHAVKESWPALPVVLATGYAELPTGSAPIGLKRLFKPFRPADLAELLAEVIETPQVGAQVP